MVKKILYTTLLSSFMITFSLTMANALVESTATNGCKCTRKGDIVGKHGNPAVYDCIVEHDTVCAHDESCREECSHKKN